MGYQRPVPYTRSTSWAAHRRRNPPSSEPGIDMFCPIGTPVLAAESGRIVDVGDSIGPATGRFVTIDLDDGRRVRYLHLKSRTVSVGQRVGRAQVVGYSGATGYGEEDWSWNVAETGGAHVHMTLWLSQRYIFGSNGSVDPEPYFDPDGSPAGTAEEDDMFTDEDRALMKRIDADNQQIKGWLRGDQNDVDRLTEIVVADRQIFERVRGANSSVDMLQDNLGQTKALRSEIAQLRTELADARNTQGK